MFLGRFATSVNWNYVELKNICKNARKPRKENFRDWKIFAKIHHDYNHYITIEIFSNFKYSQTNSAAQKFRSAVIAVGARSVVTRHIYLGFFVSICLTFIVILKLLLWCCILSALKTFCSHFQYVVMANQTSDIRLNHFDLHSYRDDGDMPRGQVHPEDCKDHERPRGYRHQHQ